jgi:hypothetical protein
MISLCYFLAFLINGKIDWLGDLRGNDPNFFNKVADIKINMGPTDLCVGPAQILLSFCEEIFNLKFDEEPCYSKLKHGLCKILLAFNLCPDQKFDWSKI